MPRAIPKPVAKKRKRAATLKASGPSRKRSKRICGGEYVIVPRDVILPFRPNVFGLLSVGVGDRPHVSIFDPELLHDGVRAVIVWADRSKPPQFGTLHRHTWRDRTNITLLQVTGSNGEYGPKSYTLGPDDVVAGEIGVFWPHIQVEVSDCLRSNRLLQYIATDRDDNDMAGGFVVERPDNLRLDRNWDELYVNPAVGLTEGRHAVIRKGPGEFAVGRVQNLVQSFSMVDKVTGKKIVFGPNSPAHWVAGPITGMGQGCGDFRHENRREFVAKYPTAQDVGVLAKKSSKESAS